MTTRPNERNCEKRKSEKKGRRKSERRKSRLMCPASILATSHENCAVLGHFCAEVITQCLYQTIQPFK